MFLIDCPWCGPRDQSEFKPGGEAHIARPPMSADMTDDAWADYVFMRRNPKGVHFRSGGSMSMVPALVSTPRATGDRQRFPGVIPMARRRRLELAALLPKTPCGEPVIGSARWRSPPTARDRTNASRAPRDLATLSPGGRGMSQPFLGTAAGGLIDRGPAARLYLRRRPLTTGCRRHGWPPPGWRTAFHMVGAASSTTTARILTCRKSRTRWFS